MAATNYDRESELKAFDDTKAGVKGLVDAGITKVPPFFIQPQEHGEPTVVPVEIPVIDLTGLKSESDADADAALIVRRQVVQKVKHATATFGFFQVVNVPWYPIGSAR